MNNIIQDIRMRDETDYIMPVWLPFLPVLFSFLVFITVVTAGTHSIVGMGSVFLLYLVGAIIGLYVMYKWIERRNKHFKRTVLLYQDLASYFESKGLNQEADSIKRLIREMNVEFPDRSPVLWIVLSLITGGLLALYVLHFLNKDFYRHDQREFYIWEDIDKAMEKLGQPLSLRRTFFKIPDRNTVIYIVLTLITAGLFGFYWVYVTTVDPNEHFKQHRLLEDELLDKLNKLES
ncbi:MAG: DUF4234 domain-containing protein [Desulfurococcales archaeon]|nr:DUF4234 domain-containing protein [Desulfurococcales archaeon]